MKRLPCLVLLIALPGLWAVDEDIFDGSGQDEAEEREEPPEQRGQIPGSGGDGSGPGTAPPPPDSAEDPAPPSAGGAPPPPDPASDPQEGSQGQGGEPAEQTENPPESGPPPEITTAPGVPSPASEVSLDVPSVFPTDI